MIHVVILADDEGSGEQALTKPEVKVVTIA